MVPSLGHGYVKLTSRALRTFQEEVTATASVSVHTLCPSEDKHEQNERVSDSPKPFLSPNLLGPKGREGPSRAKRANEGNLVFR